MVKLFNVYFPKRTIVVLLVEVLLVCIAFLSVTFLHFGLKTHLVLSAQSGYLKVGFLAAVCLFFLYCSDLYAPSSLRNSPAVSSRFIKGLGIACLVVAPIYYKVPSLQPFHGFAIMGISLAALFLVSHRQVFFAVNKSTEYSESVVILGEGRMASNVARVIQHRPELGLRLLGYLGSEWYSSFDVKQPMHLGGIEDIASLATQNHIGRVIVAMGDQRKKLPLDELLALKTSGVIIQDATDFYEVAMGKLPVETLRLSWLIFSPGFKVSTATLIYKRGVSLVLATIGLLLLLPLIALIALAIRLDAPGPVIFRQKRIGLGGQPFTLYKFRTMHLDADRGGYARPVEHNDQRITRVGRVLRRLRLDEIPQLYNILLGDMYFVGPRPFVPEQELECASQIPLYAQRWTVRPGATGWAQVQRGYCASLQDNIDKLSYDLFYIKNMSFGFDLLVLFKTIKIVLSAQGGR
jgi:sugar transferase (PEP-CTERM system associated)